MNVTLTKGHVKWVLENLLTLREGINPKGRSTEPLSSVTGARITKAVFINYCEIAGEVERRLALCGPDGFGGFLLKLVYAYGESNDYITRTLRISQEQLDRDTYKAMCFITGSWPKKRTYADYRPAKAKGYYKGGK